MVSVCHGASRESPKTEGGTSEGPEFERGRNGTSAVTKSLRQAPSTTKELNIINARARIAGPPEKKRKISFGRGGNGNATTWRLKECDKVQKENQVRGLSRSRKEEAD